MLDVFTFVVLGWSEANRHLGQVDLTSRLEAAVGHCDDAKARLLAQRTPVRVEDLSPEDGVRGVQTTIHSVGVDDLADLTPVFSEIEMSTQLIECEQTHCESECDNLTGNPDAGSGGSGSGSSSGSG